MDEFDAAVLTAPATLGLSPYVLWHHYKGDAEVAHPLGNKDLIRAAEQAMLPVVQSQYSQQNDADEIANAESRDGMLIIEGQPHVLVLDMYGYGHWPHLAYTRAQWAISHGEAAGAVIFNLHAMKRVTAAVVGPDEAFIEHMNLVTDAFVQCLDEDEAPAPDATKAAVELVKRLHPDVEFPDAVEISEELFELAQRREDIRAHSVKPLEASVREIDNQLRQEIGAHQFAIYDGKVVVTNNQAAAPRKVAFDRLEKDFPDAYEACVERGTHRVLRYSKSMLAIQPEDAPDEED